MENKKVKVFMMFYPIDWQRHAFDYTEPCDIPNKVKKLQAEHENDEQKDISFVPWSLIDEGVYSDELNWDVDSLNNWDYDTEDEYRQENLKLIEGTTLTEDFIMQHWCIAISEEVKNAIEKDL